ncbi:MAG: IS110 family transposase [Gammaproteobacteria bacterium]|nr:IS110 family transposase [Gammaproteobacteria bacterium]
MSRTPTAAVDSINPTLYVAFELGWNTWKLASTVGLGQKPRISTIPARDQKAVIKEISKALERFGLSPDSRVVSCYEAGRDGFWLHRFLTHVGVESIVVDSASIEVSRRSRRCKTDRLDAIKLVSMLVRWDLGEKPWCVVQVPSVEGEDSRQLHRELKTLKKDATRHNNRIKGLLANHGIPINSIPKDLKPWLEKQRLWDGSPLPHGVAVRILLEFDLLRFIRSQILAIDMERRLLLAQHKTKDAQIAHKLHQLGAIGVNGAWTFSTELFATRKFKNRKQVGSLVGLTPTPFDSGDSFREQGIDKAGNKWVRSMAVEIAWAWLRFQPRSALSLWYQRRFGHGSKRLRKIGIVALARKLLIALWHWTEHDVLPEGATLKA